MFWQNLIYARFQELLITKNSVRKPLLGQNIVAGIFFAKAKALGLIFDIVSRR